MAQIEIKNSTARQHVLVCKAAVFYKVACAHAGRMSEKWYWPRKVKHRRCVLRWPASRRLFLAKPAHLWSPSLSLLFVVLLKVKPYDESRQTRGTRKTVLFSENVLSWQRVHQHDSDVCGCPAFFNECRTNNFVTQIFSSFVADNFQRFLFFERM